MTSKPQYPEKIYWEVRLFSFAGYFGALLALWGAFADKTQATPLEVFLNFNFLLSLALLVVAAIGGFIFVERNIVNHAVASGESIIVLGTGIVVIGIIAMPVARVCEKFTEELSYTGSWIQSLIFFIVFIGLSVINIREIKRLGKKRIGSLGGAIFWLVPMTVVVSLWLVALGKAMGLYGMHHKDALWLKIIIEIINSVYLLVLAGISMMIYKLFDRKFLI